MSISSAERTAGPYETTGGETLLPYGFKILSSEDVTVSRRRGGGTETLQLGVDYTVTGVGITSGGNVVLVVAALAGDVYFVEGARPRRRLTDLVYNRAMPSASVNPELDSLQIQISELDARLDRAIFRSRFDDPDEPPLELPPREVSKALVTDADGNITYGDAGSGGSAAIPDPLPIDKGGTGGNSAAEARVNLGLGTLATLDSVSGDQITDLSVATADLIDKAVTTIKVADGVRSTVVVSWTSSTPPGSPPAGVVYIVGPTPTGAWVGHAKQEARWISGAWSYRVPASGDTAHALAERQTLAYDGTQWIVTGVGEIGEISGRLATGLNSGRYGGGFTRSAILDGNKVVIWGDGAGGKNCQSGARDAAAPELIPFESAVTEIKKIVSADGRHYAIDQDDYVWSAGDGAGFALGHENENDLTTFKRIVWLYSRNLKVRDIVVGRPNGTDQPFVLFLTTTDTVYSAGHGLQGQRGDGTTATGTAITQVTTQDAGTPPLANVKEVSVGGYPHTCAAVTKAGLLYTWGFNGHGQLGDGTTTSSSRGIRHPTISTASQVLACSSGLGGNVYVIRSDGSMLGAGTNSRGELAQGGADLTNKSTFVPVSYAETFASVHGGDGPGGVRCGVTTLGKLVFWGGNTYGWQGFGDTTDRYGVSLPSGSFQGSVIEVAVAGAGTEAVFVRTSDRVFAAGYNGNLGTSTGVDNANVTTFSELRGLPGGAIAELRAMGGAAAFGPMVRYDDGRIWTGGAGAQGETGWQIGTQANAAVMQDVLIKGQRGQGTSGPSGPPGLNPGVLWEFDPTTTMADPGARKVRFNNATIASANQIAVSANAAHDGNPDLSDWVVYWGNNSGSTANRGSLVVKAFTRDGVVALAIVNGAITDNGTWLLIPIAVTDDAGGAFVSAERLSFEFARTGPSGAIGGTTGASDNRLLRSDGTGGTAVQPSNVVLDDAGNMTGPGSAFISGFGATFKDNLLTFQDQTDGTKTGQVLLDDVTTGTNIIVRWPKRSNKTMQIVEPTLMVSPLDFGVDMTGVADSSVAMQAMADSGAAFCIFPAGSIRCENINITKAQTWLGPGANFNSGGTASCDFLPVTATSKILRVNTHDFVLIGLDFPGTGARAHATLDNTAVVVGDDYRTGTATVAGGSLDTVSVSGTTLTVGVTEYMVIEGAGAGGLRHFSRVIPTSTSAGTLETPALTAVTGEAMKVGEVYVGFHMERCSAASHACALHLQHAASFWITRNKLQGHFPVIAENILAVDKGDAWLFANQIEGADTAVSFGIWHKSGGGLQIRLNKILFTLDGIRVDWSYGLSGGPLISMNSIENVSRHPVFVGGSGSYGMIGLGIEDNWLNGGSGGTYLEDTVAAAWISDVSIKNNRILNAAAAKVIRVGKSATNADVSHNVINGGGFGGAVAVYVEAGVTSSQAIFNRVVNCPGGEVANLAGAGCFVVTLSTYFSLGSLSLPIGALGNVTFGTAGSGTEVVITHANNKLTFTGGSSEYVFDSASGIVPARLRSSGSSAYLALQNTGGTPASILIGVESGGDLGMQTAAGKGLNVTKSGGLVTYVRAEELRTATGVAPGSTIKVVGQRKTGWGVPTGTATRTTFDTATVTTAQLAERVKALIEDLHATAGHGLIGT